MKQRFFGFFLLVFCLVLLLAAGWHWLSAGQEPNNHVNTALVVRRGETTDEIVDSLFNKGLIRSKLAFKFYLWEHGLTGRLQAGNFRLNRSMGFGEIAEQLMHGVKDVWFTVPEGLRREEVAFLASRKFGISTQSFMHESEGMEGYLFPDTYLIPEAARADFIVKLMRDNFNRRLAPDLLAEIEKKGMSLDQTVILASLIEREVNSKKDRPIVAGILIKRWRRGWPLQVDATVQYALGGRAQNQQWWKPVLASEDFEIDSLYNTYRYVGLPIGPICSPGLDSIRAVIDYTETDYWYYLTGRDGNMHYAADYEQHLENKRKYLSCSTKESCGA